MVKLVAYAVRRRVLSGLREAPRRWAGAVSSLGGASRCTAYARAPTGLRWCSGSRGAEASDEPSIDRADAQNVWRRTIGAEGGRLGQPWNALRRWVTSRIAVMQLQGLAPEDE